MRRVQLVVLLAFAPLLALGGCGGSDTGSSAVELPPGCRQEPKPPAKRVNLKPPPKGFRVPSSATARVETSCGTFEIALDTGASPKTTQSFAYLADKGIYDDTIFHRIVPNFVVQGGDPLENGEGGPGYFVDEPPPTRTEYTRGTVAMAKMSVEPPGRSGSQFFVVVEADANLPPDYALLGRVSDGMDVVDRISRLGSRPSGTPRATVVIHGITVG